MSESATTSSEREEDDPDAVEAWQKATDAEHKAEFAREQVLELKGEVETLREERDAAEEQLAGLRQLVEEIDTRTDMLQVIEQTDEMTAKQRSVTLLQHMQRAAEDEAKHGRRASTRITKDDAKEALHYPDIDRTTYYTDMKRCERLVGDTDVCYYDSDGTESTLVLDLDAGDVPATLHGGG